MKKAIMCLVSFGIICYLIYLLGIFFRPLECDDAINKIEAFHTLGNNTQDVLVYGSSHAYYGVNTVELEDKTNLNCFNYAYSWQKINTTDLFVHDSLETQKPKYAIIDTYFIDYVLEDVDISAEIYYTRAFKESKYKQDYLKQCFGNDKKRFLSYYIPCYGFHSNWENLKVESFSVKKNYESVIKEKGSALSDNIKELDTVDCSKFQQHPLSDAAIIVIDDIVNSLQKRGTKVIFITIPWYNDQEYNYHDAVKQYSEAHDCVYFDFFELAEEIDIDCNTDFLDSAHLNRSGATKVADFLAEYIKQDRTIDKD